MEGFKSESDIVRSIFGEVSPESKAEEGPKGGRLSAWEIRRHPSVQNSWYSSFRCTVKSVVSNM